VKNLPSFVLLAGYPGYTARGIPYILFKLEEIKEVRRYLCGNMLHELFGRRSALTPFHLFYPKLLVSYKYLKEPLIIKCKHRRRGDTVITGKAGSISFFTQRRKVVNTVVWLSKFYLRALRVASRPIQIQFTTDMQRMTGKTGRWF